MIDEEKYIESNALRGVSCHESNPCMLGKACISQEPTFLAKALIRNCVPKLATTTIKNAMPLPIFIERILESNASAVEYMTTVQNRE